MTKIIFFMKEIEKKASYVIIVDTNEDEETREIQIL